jgi:hypothetical protein
MTKSEKQSSHPSRADAANLSDSFDKLLSAREAALLLGVNPRTAQLRARRALARGDQWVHWIAGAYCAPTWWWRDLLSGPIEPGRPRSRANKPEDSQDS